MRKHYQLASLMPVLYLFLILSGCGAGKDTAPVSKSLEVRGGVSGAVSVDHITTNKQSSLKRNAALLGIFISEYVSIAPTAMAAEGGLRGIGVQMHIVLAQNTIQDPDFKLLQAFGDALQVEVQDMLNRSTDRQQALDVYRNALNNVAVRSNNRFKELTILQDQLRGELKTLSKTRSDAERALKNALREKEFSDAGEKQKKVNESQAAYAEKELKEEQIGELVNTLDILLTLYGEKILAIDSNREVLISGAKVVDVPGIEELRIIQKNSTSRSKKRGSGMFDGLFDGRIL